MITLVNAVARLAEDDQFDPDTVSPGVAGFVVTGLFALAVILLLLNFNRRLRRSRYRDEIREALQEEISQTGAEPPAPEHPGEHPGTDDDSDRDGTSSGQGARGPETPGPVT